MAIPIWPFTTSLVVSLASAPQSPVPCPAFDEPTPTEGSLVPDMIQIKLDNEWTPCLVFLTASGQTWLGDSYPVPVLILTIDYKLIWLEDVFDLGGRIPENGIPNSYYTAQVSEEQVMAVFNHLGSLDAFSNVGGARRGMTSGMRYSSLMIHEGERRIRLFSTYACSPPGAFHGLNHWGPIPSGMTFNDLMAQEPEPQENARHHFVWSEAYTSLLSLIPDSTGWQSTDEFRGHGYYRGICTPQQLAAAAARRAALEQEPEDPDSD